MAGNVIVDDDLEGDDERWWLGIGAASGTALGLTVGIAQASSRPSGSALLEIKPGQALTLSVPVPDIRFERSPELLGVPNLAGSVSFACSNRRSNAGWAAVTLPQRTAVRRAVTLARGSFVTPVGYAYRVRA